MLMKDERGEWHLLLNRMHGRRDKRSKYVQRVYKDTRELSVPLGWLG